MREAFFSTLHEGGAVLWWLLLLAGVIYGVLFSSWGGLQKARAKLKAWDSSHETSYESLSNRFAEFELKEVAWVKQLVPFIGVLITAAPLVGLFGTVSGMLTTFRAMAAPESAVSVNQISMGIAEALLATQAGLVVAVPAAFVLALLQRRTELTQMELWQRWHECMAKLTAESPNSSKL